MRTCTKKYIEYPFAHRQWKHTGHCAHIHGHNWTFEFEFTAKDVNESGFVVDFGKLKWLKGYLDLHFDHTIVLCADDPFLREFHSVGGSTAWNITTVPDASSEGLAKFLFEKINELLAQGQVLDEIDLQRNIRVVKVTVYEDSRNSATYSQPLQIKLPK